MDDIQNQNNSSGLSDLNSNRSHDVDHLTNLTDRSSPSKINSSSPVDQRSAYNSGLKATIDEYPASTSSDNSNDTNESLSFVNNNGNLYYSNPYLNGSVDVNTNQSNFIALKTIFNKNKPLKSFYSNTDSTYANLLNYGYSMPQYFQNFSNNPHFNYYNSIFPSTNSYSNMNNCDNSLNGFSNLFPNMKNEQNQLSQHEQDYKKNEEQRDHFNKVSDDQDEQYQEDSEENSANNSYSSTRNPPTKTAKRESESNINNNNSNQSYLMQPPDSELIAAATRNVRTKRRTRTKFDQHQVK
jgi:hypothetical protein